MTMIRRNRVTAAGAGLLLAAAVLVGCGDGDDSASTPTATATAGTATETVTGTSSGVTADEAGLRGTLDAFYTDVAQQQQWEAAYGYLSTRCQQQMTPEEVAEAMIDQYEGEDTAELPDFEITMDGDQATVSAETSDASIPPQWTYLEDRWTIDACPQEPEQTE